jgi:hypothetical protein
MNGAIELELNHRLRVKETLTTTWLYSCSRRTAVAIVVDDLSAILGAMREQIAGNFG